jgi:FkbM family methyltransferase
VPARPLERVIHAYSLAVPEARFVQVGAHDGTEFDPLRRTILGTRWRGIMVEPVPYVFARLQNRYRTNHRLVLENVAIADEEGPREFHFLAQSGRADAVWKWYDHLGSLKRDVVLSHDHLISDIGDRIRSIEVRCITFDTLCSRNGFDRVDLLLIDTEGYDRQILEVVDLERYGIDVLVFEHLHMDQDERNRCRALLEAHDYVLASDGMDTIALSPACRRLPGVQEVFSAAAAEMLEFPQ